MASKTCVGQDWPDVTIELDLLSFAAETHASAEEKRKIPDYDSGHVNERKCYASLLELKRWKQSRHLQTVILFFPSALL